MIEKLIGYSISLPLGRVREGLWGNPTAIATQNGVDLSPQAINCQKLSKLLRIHLKVSPRKKLSGN